MRKRKIREHNSEKFIEDIKRVRTLCIYTYETKTFFEIRKNQVLRMAEDTRIEYYITNTIYVNKRNVMVIS